MRNAECGLRNKIPLCPPFSKGDVLVPLFSRGGRRGFTGEILSNQQGVSIIAAIFIIIVLAFMGVVFLTLFTTSSSTSINEMQSTRALFIAEGGMERTIRFLSSPILTERGACGTVTGNAALTNIPLGQGQFTAITDAGSPYYSAAAATLSAAITSADTTINVNTTAGYAPSGRMMIDRELIDYTGTTATSFTGAVRGRDGTTAAPHANGARVGQYQCLVTSTGGVPDLASPTAQRAVREGIQLQEGWAVGDPGGVAAQRPLFLRFNGSAWSIYNSAALNLNVPLNSVSMLSYADGWAVGDRIGNNFTVLRWNGAQWVNNSFTDATYRANLNSVFVTFSGDGWAVGDERNNNLTFLQWSGANWVVRSFTTADTERNLNGVYMWDSDNDGDADDGWTVGNCCDNAGRAWILRYQGGAWNKIVSPNEATVNINSVFMVSQNEVWVVGNDRGGGPNALAIRWRSGVGWTYTDPGVDRDLNSVFMVDTTGDGYADDGWAVGANGTILRWNGANWVAYASPTNQRLNSVALLTVNDGWAVGNAGVVLHWDGSAWASVASGVGLNLNGISLIGPRQRPQAVWQEVIP